MMRTASDKVFLQSAIRPGRIHLLQPSEFAIFIRSREEIPFLRNTANCDRKPFSRVCPGAPAPAAGVAGKQLKPFQPISGCVR